jgi:hypothetical protein
MPRLKDVGFKCLSNDSLRPQLISRSELIYGLTLFMFMVGPTWLSALLEEKQSKQKAPHVEARSYSIDLMFIAFRSSVLQGL